MICRDVREMADSFLSEELLTETNHEILRHLETCAACRADLEARRTLRASLRAAFERSSDLAPDPAFTVNLRDRLHQASQSTRPRRAAVWRGWWALAAAVLLAVGVGGGAWMRGRVPGAAELFRMAAGDHRDCALHFRLAEKPISLDEAARLFGPAYRVLEAFPPDAVTTPAGTARVLERHACVYQGRRFAHVVLQYQGVAVSLLVTATDRNSAGDGFARVDAMSVVARPSPRHAIFLVGDLPSDVLGRLADAIAPPLAQQLAGV
jgi:anti-sigma factor RsiW